ncbi:hypothetical protein GGI35DRAFT_431837 [Trichoderma velutinum]
MAVHLQVLALITKTINAQRPLETVLESRIARDVKIQVRRVSPLMYCRTRCALSTQVSRQYLLDVSWRKRAMY